MNLEFTVDDKKFKDYEEKQLREGYVSDVSYRNVYFKGKESGIEFIQGIFRLEDDEIFYNCKTIPLIAGDYVGFALDKVLFSSDVGNNVLYLKKYNPIHGKVLATYNLYYSGPRHNPYDLIANKFNRSLRSF